MTPNTARVLAHALQFRDEAADKLATLMCVERYKGTRWLDYERDLAKAAEAFVHEQRIINRIVHDERDEKFFAESA